MKKKTKWIKPRAGKIIAWNLDMTKFKVFKSEKDYNDYREQIVAEMFICGGFTGSFNTDFSTMPMGKAMMLLKARGEL